MESETVAASAAASLATTSSSPTTTTTTAATAAATTKFTTTNTGKMDGVDVDPGYENVGDGDSGRGGDVNGDNGSGDGGRSNDRRRGKTYNTFDTERPPRIRMVEQDRPADTTPQNGGGGPGPTYTVQEAIDTAGFGWYQLRLAAIFGLAFVAETMEIMLLSVLGPVLKCEFYLSPFQESLLTIVVFTGMIISGNFWGKLGDVYGRTKSICLSTMMSSYFGLLSALSPNYWWVVVNRFLLAIGLGGFLQLYTLLTELIPTKSRSYCVLLAGFVWALGSCLEVVVAMGSLAFLNWRWLLVFTSLPTILFVCLSPLIPESPRYQLINGRGHEAVVTLRKMARVNGKQLPSGQLIEPPVKVEADNSRIQHLFSPKFLRTTLLLSFGLAATNIAYYGTALLTTSLFDKNDGCHGYKGHSESGRREVTCSSLCTSLGLQDYTDLLLTSLGDTPGLVVCMVMMAYWGRITTLTVLTGLYATLMAFCNICSPRLVLVTLLFCARAAAIGCSQGIYIYITEVYPTSIRATGMGWSQTVKSAGVVVASILSNVLVSYSSYLAISSYALIGMLGAVAIAMLPYETKNKNTKDTVEENIT